MRKVSILAKFHVYSLLVFKIQLIKDRLVGLKPFRDFRETPAPDPEGVQLRESLLYCHCHLPFIMVYFIDAF